MKINNRIITLAILMAIAVIFSACSSSKSIVDPAPNIPDQSVSFGSVTEDSRSLVAVYEMVIDPVTMTVTLEPLDRYSQFHYPLSNYYPSVLSITRYGLDPAHNNDFFADIKLKHPYPGSGIDGFDARLICILPANSGVSFMYPVFNVNANNKALMNPDGYTRLWDGSGGSIAGNTNPYLSYFKDQPNRVWSSTGKKEDTQRLYVDFDGFGGPAVFKLVVDVSTGFPNPPHPGPDNAPEPVAISTYISDGLTVDGGEATVEVTFLDWQGYTNIKCKIEAPDLMPNPFQLFYDRPGLNPNEYIFKNKILNMLGASAGDHKILIAAWDIPTDVHVYNEATAYIPFKPSAWNLDPARANVDLTTLGSFIPPKPGSDLGVIDGSDPDVNGVVMYELEDMVVRMNLELTSAELYGYSYLPQDGDPTNPHPNPEIFPAGRIDGNNNGVVVQSWIDSHLGCGPDLAGQWQREDALIGVMRPQAGWLEFCIAALPNMAHDNMTTPDYDESLERPRLADVYEEYDLGSGKYTVSGIWSGTVVWDIETGNTYNPVGVMGGLKEPYYADPFIVMDWGLWIFTGPPSNEIKAGDASQDPWGPYQYWGYSGTRAGNALIGQYDKDGATIAAMQPSNRSAKLLDLQLIPLQNPPLDVNGILQQGDWLAVLLDNQTIEIIDTYFSSGQIIDIIDLSGLSGDVKYLDVANTTADIFISHTDGVTPFCSVFTL